MSLNPSERNPSQDPCQHEQRGASASTQHSVAFQNSNKTGRSATAKARGGGAAPDTKGVVLPETDEDDPDRFSSSTRTNTTSPLDEAPHYN